METWRASLSLSWYKDGGYGFHWELPSIRWGCLCWRSRAHARPLFPSCICACSVSPPWPPLFRHHACMEHAKWVCVSPFLLFSLPETTWYLFLDSNLCAFSFDITIESINCQIFFASPRVWFALNLRVCYSWNQSSIITSKQAPLSNTSSLSSSILLLMKHWDIIPPHLWLLLSVCWSGCRHVGHMQVTA